MQYDAIVIGAGNGGLVAAAPGDLPRLAGVRRTKAEARHSMVWNTVDSKTSLGGIAMPEKVVPGPVQDTACIREAVCIHTKKIFDSCREEDIAYYKIR